MTRSTLPADDGRLPVYPLRVHRIEAGEHSIVRFLSARASGCFVHWYRGQSVYCEGKDCSCQHQRLARFWKGYDAAEVWRQADETWNPVCLEITEHCELDLRHIYARGQVWALYRDLPKQRKPDRVHASWLEDRDPKTFPSAFDLIPCLLTLYHVTRIQLDHRNPMPMRTMVRASLGDAPKLPARQNDASDVPSEEEQQKVRELLRARRNGQNGAGKPKSDDKEEKR